MTQQTRSTPSHPLPSQFGRLFNQETGTHSSLPSEAMFRESRKTLGPLSIQVRELTSPGQNPDALGGEVGFFMADLNVGASGTFCGLEILVPTEYGGKGHKDSPRSEDGAVTSASFIKSESNGGLKQTWTISRKGKNPGKGWLAALGAVPCLFPLLLFILSSGALAKPSNLEEARQLLRRAQQHYEEGSYELAAGLFIATWDLHPHSPTLLFNAAQAYRLCGRQEEARDWYERFLQEMPDSPNREEVESRISQLGRLIDRRHGRTVATSPTQASEKHAQNRAPSPDMHGRAKKEEKIPRELSRSAAPDSSGESVKQGENRPSDLAWAPRSSETNLSDDSPSQKITHSEDWDFEDPSPITRRLNPKRLSQLQIILITSTGLLATGAAISYGIAHWEWSAMSSSERPRAEADQQIQSADTAHAVSLGLSGAALLVGAGFGVTFAF